MKKRYGIAILCVLLLLAVNSTAGLFGPSNYDECITESMKGVTSKEAALAIMTSCRNQFPFPPNPKSYFLKHDELSQLTGRAGLSDYDDTYSGKIYNGNHNITVTEIRITVTTASNHI